AHSSAKDRDIRDLGNLKFFRILMDLSLPATKLSYSEATRKISLSIPSLYALNPTLNDILFCEEILELDDHEENDEINNFFKGPAENNSSNLIGKSDERNVSNETESENFHNPAYQEITEILTRYGFVRIQTCIDTQPVAYSGTLALLLSTSEKPTVLSRPSHVPARRITIDKSIGFFIAVSGFGQILSFLIFWTRFST
ncbi:1304_t:CDS:2, partial [Funneliformis caledonium]